MRDFALDRNTVVRGEEKYADAFWRLITMRTAADEKL